MKILKQLSINSIIIFVFLASAIQVFAQATPVSGTSGTQSQPAPQQVAVKFDNPLINKSGSLMQLISDILNNIILPIASVGVIAWIIWAGFQFVLAQGKPGEIEKAKQNLLWSLVGTGILLGAAAISQVIQNTVNSFMS